MKLIIFPFVGQKAEESARTAENFGGSVLRVRPEDLPTIHDAEFDAAFTNAVNKFVHAPELCSTFLFCPVASVHIFMREFLKIADLPIKLLGSSPIQQEMNAHRTLMSQVRMLQPLAKVPEIELAGILKRAMSIYGESSEIKIAAMVGVFDDAPKAGHVVEIGSLAGRTASVLGYMSERSGIHSLFTIDPWSPAMGVQADSPATLIDMTNEWNWEMLAEMYSVNTFDLRSTSHVRGSSDHVHLHEDFVISVLHIDGNHDYACVRVDCDKYASRILPGGWLILDDYEWAHGDGPKRAGDELLAERAHEIEKHFVCGNALFVKFKL